MEFQNGTVGEKIFTGHYDLYFKEILIGSLGRDKGVWAYRGLGRQHRGPYRKSLNEAAMDALLYLSETMRDLIERKTGFQCIATNAVR